MARTHKYLIKNEKLYFEVTPHWITLLKSITPFLVMVIFFIFFIKSGLYNFNRLPNQLINLAYSYRYFIFSVISLIFLLPLFSALIRYFFTISSVSSKRVLFKAGLINREFADIPLQNVESCDCQQSLLGQMLNYGNVVVRGSGSTSLRLYSVKEPLKFKNCVMASLQQLKEEEKE